MAELIEMPFGLWTPVLPRNRALGGGLRSPHGNGKFWKASRSLQRISGMQSISQHYLVGGSSDAAFCCQYCSRVVSVLDSSAVGPGFKSQPRCCRVTVLGKLFTIIVPLFTKK